MAVKEVDIQDVPSGSLSANYAANKGPTIGVRHIQAIIMFFAFVIGYLTRNSFSAAFIAMTLSNSDLQSHESSLLTSFQDGIIWLPVLAGLLGNVYGPKFFLLSAIVINSTAFILIPLAASTLGSNGVMICRVVQGLSQGFLFPCGHAFLGKWAAPTERSTLAMMIYNGKNIGIIASFIITDYIISSRVGWSGVFYLYGAVGLAWSVLYFFFGFNAPACHPSISKEERCYIETSLAQDSKKEKNTSAPWKIIMTVLPVLAVIVANMGSTLGVNMTMTVIPEYLYYKFLDWNYLTRIALWPYLFSAICGAIAACLSDYLIRKNYITIVNSRRLFHLIASYGEVICLVLLFYVAKDTTTAVILITTSQAFHGASFAGYLVNEIDLTPRFAGILRGISSTVSQLIEVHYLSLVIPNGFQDVNSWRTPFLVSVVICFVTATLFACCASGTKQKWDEPRRKTDEGVERL